MLFAEKRFKHSKLISRAAEKAEKMTVPNIDFGGRFEDVSAAVLKREKSSLTPATKSKLIAVALARTNRR